MAETMQLGYWILTSDLDPGDICHGVPREDTTDHILSEDCPCGPTRLPAPPADTEAGQAALDCGLTAMVIHHPVDPDLAEAHRVHDEAWQTPDAPPCPHCTQVA